MSTRREDMTEAQVRVFEDKTRLKKNKWYSGVCVDSFPDDKECREDFEGAVTSICFETEMWDGPT